MSFVSGASPLETYNSLSDKHLVNFFRSARMRKHLVKNGLITESGEILPETEYRELRMRESQKRALLELIAQAIVERSLEAERIRQGKIRRTLEEICKLHRVRRIREDRQKREGESILMQLVPRSPRTSDKLDPLPMSLDEHSVLLRDGALCVPISDIDDPDLAVMDKRSRIEVAKLQEAYNRQRTKERKAGQPPYLYLFEPGMSKHYVRETSKSKTRSQSHSVGTKKTAEAKSYKDSKTGLHGTDFSKDGSDARDDQGDRNGTEVSSIRDRKRSDHSTAVNRSESVEHSGASPTGNPLGVNRQVKAEMDHIRSSDESHRKPLDKGYSGRIQKHKAKAVAHIPSLVLSPHHPPHGVLIPDKPLPRSRPKSGVSPNLAYGHNFKSRPPETAVSCQCGDSDPDYVEHKPAIVIPKPVKFRLEDDEDPSAASSLPPIVEKNNLVKSPCIIKLMYLGPIQPEEALGCSTEISNRARPRFDRMNALEAERGRRRWVTVIQQPSGANTITVFKGLLQPGDIFEFSSRRVNGFPFSLSLCIDGSQVCRVSTCCEYRHKRGARIGGKNGQFLYLDVHGSMPCLRCQTSKTPKQEKYPRRRPAQPLPDSGDTNVEPSAMALKEFRQALQGDVVRDMQSTLVEADFGADYDTRTNIDSNVSRRLAKSTRWECFRPVFTELPDGEDEVKEYTADDVPLDLHYGIEELEDSEPLESIVQPHESVTQAIPIVDSDINPPRSSDFESGPLDDPDAEEDEYDNDEFIDDEYVIEQDEDDDDVADRICPLYQAHSAEKESELSDCLREIGHLDFKFDRPAAVHDILSEKVNQFDSATEDKNIAVTKIDAFYQRCDMFSLCPTKHQVEHYPGGIKEFQESVQIESDDAARIGLVFGDAVKRPSVSCDFYLTDIAEEAPIHDYSAIETLKTESSGASGDRMPKEMSASVGYSSSNVLHRCAKLTPVVVQEDNQFYRSTSQTEVPVSPECFKLQSCEDCFVQHGAKNMNPLGTAPSCLMSLPSTSLDHSRSTVTQSVTFASSTSHSNCSRGRVGDFDEELKPASRRVHIGDGIVSESLTESQLICSQSGTGERTSDSLNILSIRKTPMTLPECSAENVYQTPDCYVPGFAQSHIPLTENSLNQTASEDTTEDTSTVRMHSVRSKNSAVELDELRHEPKRSAPEILLQSTSSSDALASESDEEHDIHEMAPDATLISPFNIVGLDGDAKCSFERKRD